MPEYNYGCRNCNQEFTKVKPISARKEPESNPCPTCGMKGSIFVKIGATKVVHEAGSRLKVDDGWREVQSKMKETYKINNIKEH
jgi:putative FmdB family regulatory protein